ncbi:MAG: hypothetical protein EOS21_16045 [Mesorhizobium sp.]|nr:MAG: hypothetical protein EOS21_16045 [Mesorhizobium sp.]
MNRLVAWFGRVAFISLGYVIAVLVAVAATFFVLLLPTVLPDGGAWGSFYRSVRGVGFVYQSVLMTTFLTALPGFLLTLLVARGQGWNRWLPFACAGALNAILALLVLSAWTQTTPLNISAALLLPCLPGGFSGGYAYWAVTGRFLIKQRGAVSA